MKDIVIRKVACCSTCEYGFLKSDGYNVFVVCSIAGVRHPGEICNFYEED